MKKIASLVLAMLLVLTVSAAALSETLVMGSNLSFPPFDTIDDSGAPAGFDIEIGKLIAEKMGMDFFVEDMAFDGLVLALESGKIDMVIAAMTITEARKEKVNFSDPYYVASQKVIVPVGYEGVASLDDLKDKVVAVQEGTTGHILCTETLEMPEAQVVSFRNAADAVLELLAGRVDAVVLDAAPADVFVARSEGKLAIVEGIEMEDEFYGIAIAKDNEALLAAANEVLAEIKENGEYEELIAKWFE